MGNNNSNLFSNVVGFLAGVSVIGGVYYFYRNNIWRPDLQLLSCDFEAGVARIMVNGKEKVILANSTTHAGGDYGIRFQSSEPYTKKWDRLELVKNDIVFGLLSTLETKY